MKYENPIVGFRVPRSQKIKLKKMAKNQGLTLSDYLRKSLQLTLSPTHKS